MSTRRVVITGLGLLTPVGNQVENSWNNLLSGMNPVKPIEYFDVTNFATKFIAKDKIKDFNKDENLILSFKKDYLLIEKIQKEGINIMSTKEFGRGYPEQLQKIKKKLS